MPDSLPVTEFNIFLTISFVVLITFVFNFAAIQFKQNNN